MELPIRLAPRAVSPAQTEKFQLSLANTSYRPVTLSLPDTRFKFNDGIHFFNAPLSSPATIPARGSATLSFDSTLVDPAFTNSRYTPLVFVKGGGSDSLLAGNLSLNSGALSVFTVKVVRVDASQIKVARGDSFTVDMRVSNQGPDTVNVDTSQTFVYMSGFPQSHIFPLSEPTTLIPNSTNNVYSYRVRVPVNLATGQYSIDGQITGVTVSGTPVFDGQADIPGSITVGSGASIAVQSLLPSPVTTGDSFTFRSSLRNDGDHAVILNRDSTRLSFGNDGISLLQSYSLTPGDIVAVQFSPHLVSSPALAAAYDAQLRLYGTENEAIFDTTIMLLQAVTVHDTPEVIVEYLNVLPDTAVQHQDSIRVQAVLKNSGTLNAPVTISKPDSIYVSSRQETVFPAGYELVNFPITLAAEAVTDTIDFIYSLNENYPQGVDTVGLHYTFTDGNSGTNYPVAPPDFDTYLVQTRARLALQSSVLTPDTVSQGQSGIQFNFTVRNDGESAARVSDGDVAVQFTNPHSKTLIFPTLPVDVPSGALQQFQYQIGIDSNSGTGWDRLNLSVSHSDRRSAKSYTDVNQSNLDSLYIVTPADSNNLQIQYVQISPVNVNQGQAGIGALVRLRNLSPSPVDVDSLTLLASRAGISYQQITPLGSLAGGASANYNFSLSVDSTMLPGKVSIDARYVATDRISGHTFSHTGSNLPDTLNIQTPAGLRVTPVNISQDTVSAGKKNLTVDFRLVNDGQAAVKVSAVVTQITPVPNDITLSRISPAGLTTISGTDSTLFVYRLDTNADTGSFTIDFSVTGKDQNDTTRTVGPVNSVSQAELAIRQPGAIAIDSVIVQTETVYRGQEDIPATVYMRNSGQMPISLNNVNLTFAPGPGGFTQNLQHTLPDTLLWSESTALAVNFSVKSTADTGAITVGAQASGTEINLQNLLIGSAGPSARDTVLVKPAPQLRIFSVTSNYDSVSLGQQNITVRLKVRNNGGIPLTVDSVALKFSKGRFNNRKQAPGLTLPAGSGSILTFPNVTVDSSAQQAATPFHFHH